MDEVKEKLTVFFENPFWVGVIERIEKSRLSVCKVTFGAEPKDNEVWEFVLKNYCRLKFSPSVDFDVKPTGTNPKRIQREARKQTLQKGIGTKSQQALQLQREEMKIEHKHISKEEKDAEKLRRFSLKQQKRKEKHKGR
ncbi:MAG: YjdF family protein [Acutalibacteraceae bacterium]